MKIYHIYHIKGVKFGCTDNHKRRLKEQGYSEYSIHETHTDIYLASDREQELNREYGYPVDPMPYYESVNRLKKAAKISAEKRKGVPLSDDHKASIGIAHKGIEFTEERKKNISTSLIGNTNSLGLIVINKDNKVKRVRKDDLEAHINDGWKKGYNEDFSKSISLSLIGHDRAYGNKNVRGRIWITDGQINKMIYPENLEEHLIKGFVKGQIRNKK